MKLISRLGLALVAVALLSGGALVGGRTAKPAEATANYINVLSQRCSFDGKVTILLNWQPVQQGPQWVDLSLTDNGFFPGTFVGFGQVDSSVGSITWDGLMPGLTHYLRVNSLTPFGWQPSDTIAFTTTSCAGQGAASIIPAPATYVPGNVSLVSQQCLPDGSVSVVLGWNPVQLGTIWADLSITDQRFMPGSFVNYGNIPATQSTLTWNGLLPHRMHFLRLNNFAGGFWNPSNVATFTTRDC